MRSGKTAFPKFPMVTMEANEGPVALRVEVTILVNFQREPGHENYYPAVV